VIFTWASGKSAFWNIGFVGLLVLVAATVLIVVVAFVTRAVLH